MKDLDITPGKWGSAVPATGSSAKITANGIEIAEATGPLAVQNAALMAAAPNLYDVLTDVLVFLRKPENASATPRSTKEWSELARRAQEVIGCLPKRNG
jgi:hypothetical protein